MPDAQPHALEALVGEWTVEGPNPHAPNEPIRGTWEHDFDVSYTRVG